MKILSALLLVLVIIFGLTFAILNAKPVHLNYYFGTNDISLSLLLVLTLAIGAFIGFVCSLPIWIRLRLSNSKLRHHMKKIEKEVDNLRSAPLKDSH